MTAEAAPKTVARRSLRDVLARKSPFFLLTGLLALVIILLTIVPLGRVVTSLFWVDGSLTAQPFRDAIATGIGGPLMSTVIVVVASMVLAVLIGGGLAWVNERTDARMGTFSDIMPLVPFLVPPVAGSVGWILLLSPDSGYLNAWWMKLLSALGVDSPGPLLNIYSWSGMILVFTTYGVAFTYMMIAPALRTLDSNLEEASKVAGASPMRTMFKVTLPAILPAVAAGALLWGWIAFAMVDIPTMLGTGAGIEMLSQRIVSFLVFSYPPQQGPAVVLSSIVTAVVLTLWFIQSRILRANKFATMGGKGAKANPIRLGKWKPVIRGLMLLYVGLTAILPTLALVLVGLLGSWRVEFSLSELNLDTFRTVLTDPYTLQGLSNSLMLGFAVATVVVVIAAAISRFTRLAGPVTGRIFDAGIKLPATLGSLIIVVGMALVFTGPPFMLGGTITILLVAYIVLSMPHTTITTDAAVSGVGESLVEASSITGAGEGKTFLKVVLPLLVPALVSAWAIAFVRTFSDLTASSMLAGAYNPVIGFQMLESSRNGSFATTAVLGALMAVLCAVVMTVAVTFGRRTSRWATGGSAKRSRRDKVETTRETPAPAEVGDPTPDPVTPAIPGGKSQ